MSGKGKVLVDGDVVAYRAAFATQDREIVKPYNFLGVYSPSKPNPKLYGLSSSNVTFLRFGYQESIPIVVFLQTFTEADTNEKVEELMGYIISDTVEFPFPSKGDFQTYLTGKTNFRFDIAKSYPYKGNRKAVEKPKHLASARQYMMDKYDAIVSENEEADDLIGKAAAALDYKCVVASIDKDMLQLPCWHFNFGRNEWTKVEPFEGLKFVYHQMLTGDVADNIIGLYGIGPKKADKLLQDCHTEEDLWTTVLKAYEGDKERLVENARLLWLRRYDNELWEPPKLD